MELKLNDEWKLDASTTATSHNNVDSETNDSSDFNSSRNDTDTCTEDCEVTEDENERVDVANKSDSKLVKTSAVEKPLYYASLLGIEEIWEINEATVKHLINRKADVNQKGGYFRIALMAAVNSSTIEITKILIAAGADVCAANDHGSTALYFAAWRGEVDIINALLDEGALVNAQTKYGTSALHFACRAGWKQAVEVLKSRGADMEASNSQYYLWPIHFAVQKENEYLACYLLDTGASAADPQDPSGPPPLLLQALYSIEGTELITTII
ncbi:ankyrin repeat-containing domain protein [Xylaria curta]|nr:ankyrin repeat-containing domain protein [Xylaria curta]